MKQVVVCLVALLSGAARDVTAQQANAGGRAPAGEPVKSIGRVNVRPPSTINPPICDTARAARARNSPAAPTLEAQCRAAGGDPSRPAPPVASGGAPVPVCDAAIAARARNAPNAAELESQCRSVGGNPAIPTTAELALHGAELANQDPLSEELRNRQRGPVRRGFDIGMAASEGNTLWGPGKQAILDSLSPLEQEGFKTAASYSLDRNANLSAAMAGAAIAEADPVLSAARTRAADVRYWLGFDIATGIFGDPALGALGAHAARTRIRQNQGFSESACPARFQSLTGTEPEPQKVAAVNLQALPRLSCTV